MNVFITGGTSGIGLALAEYYINNGHKVGVCGRDISKINAALIEAQLQAYQLDVYTKTDLQSALNNFCQGEHLDLLIASAGHYYNELSNGPDYEECTNMLKVNMIGMINAFEAARACMHRNKKGHLVSIASVSSLLDYPKATVYTKSKRANVQMCDAYRTALAPFGIWVTAVMPGYVDTLKLRSLNNNDLSKKMFLLSCHEAVAIITNAIEKKKDVIIFPPKMKYLMTFLSVLPKWLLSLIMSKQKQHACRQQ